jgi:hypothetical protein
MALRDGPLEGVSPQPASDAIAPRRRDNSMRGNRDFKATPNGVPIWNKP